MLRFGIILGAQLADAAAFGLAVQRVGIGGEANPVMAAIFTSGGLGAVLALKAAGGTVAAVLGPRLGRWWLLPAGAGLAGAATALTVLL